MRTLSIDNPTTVEIFRDTALTDYPSQECEQALDYIGSLAPLVTINNTRAISLPHNEPSALNVGLVRWPMDTFRASLNIVYTSRRLEMVNPQTQKVRSIAGVAFRKMFGKPSIALISALPSNMPKAATIHETGHLFRLEHCQKDACVMGKSLELQAYTHRKYTSASRARLEDRGLLDMHYTTSYDAPAHFCQTCADKVKARGKLWSLAREGYKFPIEML